MSEYNGPSHQLRRWAQEMLAYHFTTLHRNKNMMIDVDALNRGRYIDSLAETDVNPLILQYETYLATALNKAFSAAPAAFNPSLFPTFTTKCPPTHSANTTITTPTHSLLSLPVTILHTNTTPTHHTHDHPSLPTAVKPLRRSKCRFML